MDSFREYPSDFDPPAAAVDEPPAEVALAIGTDERRMHVRAYNYWVSLLDGRDFPSIEDLEPGDVSDFADHSVLLDFTAGRDNPATPYIGTAVRAECGIDSDIKTIADVPSRSLLSRLTDHYLQIIANRAPIGFEAEFVNQRGVPICYRGILMPFSSDGDTIDFIYGVINWKQALETFEEIDGGAEAPAPEESLGASDMSDEIAEASAPDDAPAFYEPESAEDLAAPQYGVSEDPAPVHFPWQDAPEAGEDSDELPELVLGEDAGLADRLWAARESVEALKSADCRSRAALYGALAMAYDFALASLAEPEDYAELLEESGVKAQSRAPMTPVVKLVFGIDYDKTRLTEFAAALSYAQREQVAAGGFLQFIEGFSGGLKAIVAAERQARRPEPRPDKGGEKARARLREARPLSLGAVSTESEFALVLARRCAEGGVEAVALVDDEAMLERAIRRASL